MSLESCYSELSNLTGTNTEPLSVIQQVERHRQYWRPSETRLVLLAESHVRTTDRECRRSLKRQNWMPSDLPLGFVRLVYCLGYGENELLNRPIRPNRGTPHFWKIFFSCLNEVTANGGFAPIVKRMTPALKERAGTKLEILKTLKARGIWLIDASIMALYPPRPNVDRQRILRISWRCYVRAEMDGARPKGVLCIGLGVARSLKSELDNLGVTWGVVPQPNARLSQEQHACIFDVYRRSSEKPSRAHEFSEKWCRRL